MGRVFLVLSDESAALVETVLQARIDKIDDTECNNAEVRAQMQAERARLSNTVGQLMAEPK